MDTLVKILIVIYSSIFIVGFTGNLIMVFATLYSRNLRSICNLLICACCFFDALLFTDIIAFVVSMFIPISQEHCFYINIPADFGAFASNACVFSVGIDRLMAVLWPTMYKRLEHKKRKVFLLLLLFPVIYASVLIGFGFTQRAKRIVVCLLPESLGHAYDMFALSSFGINLFVPPIYIYVYFRIRKMNSNNSMKAVFKSLMATVCLVVCGWMTTDLIGVLTLAISMDPYVAKMIQLYCGTFIFTSSAFNAVFYYKMSRDYRVAIRSLLGLKGAAYAIGSTSQLRTVSKRMISNVQTE